MHGMCWECSGNGYIGNLHREYAEYARQAAEEDALRAARNEGQANEHLAE